MNLRLRERIAWYNTLAVAITIAVVSIAVYLVVYLTSFLQLDESIRLESDEALSNLNWKGDSIIIYKMPEWEEGEHSQAEVSPIFLQVLDLKGRIVFRSANLVNELLTYYPSTRNEIFYSVMIRDQHIRQGQFPVRNEFDKKIGTLIVSVSEEATIRILKNLRMTLVIAFPILLIIIFLVTSLAASKGIAPINDLIASTSGIDDSTMHTRLSLPGTRDEVFRLAYTINDLLERIENSILRQKQFTADASHELRTPLAAIRGTLEVIILKPHDPEYYKSRITDVIHQVDRLDNLISQLLQLTRLDSGTVILKNETITLFPFLQYLSEKWHARLKEREISLAIKIPEKVAVSADSFSLGLIFDNLLSNAIKYGKQGGNINLVWNDEKKSVLISDNGPGIPSKYLPYIFDRFFRTDSSRNSKVEGNGLGLAIVKRLADMQKLKLSVKSEEGSGTEFELMFPA